MSANSVTPPIYSSKTVDWQYWTDSIGAGATLTKTISVGAQYRGGIWALVAPDSGLGGATGGPDGSTRAGYSGNIVSSSSASEGRWGLAGSGYYSSMWSSVINTYVSGNRWNSTGTGVRLNKVYFDGSGNVAFEFTNNVGTTQTLAVRASVEVWP